MLEENRFENLLKSLRVRKGKVWTQAKTARLLGVSLRTYVGWENGESLPSQRDLKNIAATFELNDADTEIEFAWLFLWGIAFQLFNKGIL